MGELEKMSTKRTGERMELKQRNWKDQVRLQNLHDEIIVVESDEEEDEDIVIIEEDE